MCTFNHMNYILYDIPRNNYLNYRKILYFILLIENI